MTKRDKTTTLEDKGPEAELEVLNAEIATLETEAARDFDALLRENLATDRLTPQLASWLEESDREPEEAGEG